LPPNLSARELDMPPVALTRRGNRRAIAISGAGEVNLGPRKLQKRAPVQEAGEVDLGPRKLRSRAPK
jgi:hypothetical protein